MILKRQGGAVYQYNSKGMVTIVIGEGIVRERQLEVLSMRPCRNLDEMPRLIR